MGDYADGKNVLLRRPEPGRPIHVIKETKQATQSFDTNAIADAVIKAIVNKMPSSGIITKTIDDFDNSASLSKLAEAMSTPVERSGNNVEGIGVIKETKKDKEETKKTIDLLSKLGD